MPLFGYSQMDLDEARHAGRMDAAKDFIDLARLAREAGADEARSEAKKELDKAYVRIKGLSDQIFSDEVRHKEAQERLVDQIHKADNLLFGSRETVRAANELCEHHRAAAHQLQELNQALTQTIRALRHE